MFFYLVCALFGWTRVLLQFLLMLLGFGGGADAGSDFGDDPGHTSTTDIFKILSFRTLTAGIAFFGLGGLAGLTGLSELAEWTGKIPMLISFIIALLSGLTAAYIVYYLYLSAARMKDDGSLSSETLIGSTGSVYVRIPAAKAGAGKVLICQQGRTVEYEAITAGDELKTSTPIVVVGVVSSTTVEVVFLA
jgi:membrane protein implicated in regulation of membrane protease activity